MVKLAIFVNFEKGADIFDKQKNKKVSAVPLDVEPERRTKRCSLRFRPGDRFGGEFRNLSPGSED